MPDPNSLRHLFTITHAPEYDSNDLRKLDRPWRFGRGMGQPGAGTAFQLFDADGNLMARGRTWDDGSGDEAFAPLDFATNEWGATEMQLYEKHPDGQWHWSIL
jgi:hypothetical protein